MGYLSFLPSLADFYRFRAKLSPWKVIMEGYKGIEPSSSGWRPDIIAIIRIPHKYAHLCAGRPRLVVYKLPARMGLGHCLTAHGAVGEFRNPDLTLTKGVFFPLNYDSIHICVRVYHRYLTS